MTTSETATPSPLTGPVGASAALIEMYGLSEHLNLCRNTSGRLFNLRCQSDRVKSFVTARFVTSLTGIAIVIGVGYLLV